MLDASLFDAKFVSILYLQAISSGDSTSEIPSILNHHPDNLETHHLTSDSPPTHARTPDVIPGPIVATRPLPVDVASSVPVTTPTGTEPSSTSVPEDVRVSKRSNLLNRLQIPVPKEVTILLVNLFSGDLCFCFQQDTMTTDL